MFVSQYNNKFYNHKSLYHHDTTHNHAHNYYGFPKQLHEGAFSMFPLHHKKQKIKYITPSGKVVIKYT